MKCLRPFKHWDCGFESHPRYGCLSAFILFVLSCVGGGLATGWSPVQGVLPIVYKIRSWRLVLMGNRPEDTVRNVKEEAIILQNVGPRFVDSLCVYFRLLNRVLWNGKAVAQSVGENKDYSGDQLRHRKPSMTVTMVWFAWAILAAQLLVVPVGCGGATLSLLQHASTLYGHHQVHNVIHDNNPSMSVSFISSL
jgi:hypothetical protein